MPHIKFIEASGEEHGVSVEAGTSAMQAAVWNSIRGIDGDCGGVAACATCHVHVDAGWLDRAGVAGEQERTMLELAEGVDDTSRLACQIAITDDLDGIVLHLPESQF